MKFGRKLTLAAGATVTAALVVAASYGVGLATYHGEFQAPAKAPWTKGHASAATEEVNNGQCTKCHRTSIPGNALRGARSAHQTHLASIFLTFGRMTSSYDSTPSTNGVKTGCIICHPDTGTSNYLRVSVASKNAPIGYEGDVSYAGDDPDTSTKLRKHVNPGFCLRCHGPLVDFAQHVGAISCRTTACHGDDPDGGEKPPTDAHADTPWIKTVKVKGTSDQKCRLCHGGKAWYQEPETNPVTPNDPDDTPNTP